MILNIAIIGAGSAGLACGLALDRAGHHVTVYERHKDPTPVGAGLLLQPTGIWVFKQLGLNQEIHQVSNRIQALIGHNHRKRKIMNLHYAGYHPDAYGLGIHRGQLMNVLLSAVNQSSVTLKLNQEADEIYTHDRASVSSAGCSEDYDLVIIAAGSSTSLRDQPAPARINKAYPWGALWGITDSKYAVNDKELIQRYKGAQYMGGMLPSGIDPVTGETVTSLFWSVPITDSPPNKQQALTDMKALWPQLAEAFSSLDQDQWLLAEYRDVVHHQYHDKHWIMIGDAAHSMSPQLGQGGNLALMDAWVLAKSLSQYPQQDLNQALANYQQLRLKHIQFYQRMSRWLTPFYQSNSCSLALIRDYILPFGQQLPWINRQVIRTLTGVKTGIFLDRDILPKSDIF